MLGKLRGLGEGSHAMCRKDRDVAFVLSLFWGLVGIDRMYLGQLGLGWGKLLTLGGVGVWWVVDLFLIRAAADEVNAANGFR